MATAQKTKSKGRKPGTTYAKASEVLMAVRAAAKLAPGEVAPDAEVAMYAELKKTDLKAFVMMRDRLEREQADRARECTEANVASGKLAGKAGSEDGYDRAGDRVTPVLERLIEEWLERVKKRVEAKK